MDIKALQQLIRNTSTAHGNFVDRYQESLRYYMNRTDITNRTNGKAELNKNGKNEPLRKADNRVPANFHQLLVDQEAGYVAGQAPQIDVGKDSVNKKINDVLGDNFANTMNKLVVDAANGCRSCLHYWIDEDGNFRYGVVPTDQVTAIYDTTLDDKLIGVLRSYKQLDTDTGKYYTVHEYWDDKVGQFYKQPTESPNSIEPLDIIQSYDLTAGYETGQGNVYRHQFGRVPFIIFPKNKYKLPDLLKYKGLIDAYDDIYNGYLNDLDDVQQVILVLKNYGGTDLDQFMNTLRKDKAIKFNNAGNGDQSGVDKLTIDIPKDARDDMLSITRQNIFLFGQGVDPANFESSNASGVAIKMLYSHLDLKANNTQSNFKGPLNELVRAILNYLNVADADGIPITQTWKRTRIEDDLSKAQTVSTVANFTSKEAIAKANPIVNDWQQELKDQEKDRQESDAFASEQVFGNNDDYSNSKDDQDKGQQDKQDDQEQQGDRKQDDQQAQDKQEDQNNSKKQPVKGD